jgi:hypothetical protein
MAKACPIWAEIEVSACPDVLVQTNLADAAHEHEGFAAVDAQHSFKRLPVCLRHVSIIRADTKSIGHAGMPSFSNSNCFLACSVGTGDDDIDDDDVASPRDSPVRNHKSAISPCGSPFICRIRVPPLNHVGSVRLPEVRSGRVDLCEFNRDAAARGYRFLPRTSASLRRGATCDSHVTAGNAVVMERIERVNVERLPLMLAMADAAICSNGILPSFQSFAASKRIQAFAPG